jgi:hypothetical protein
MNTDAITTAEWAISHRLSADPTPASVGNPSETYPRSAREIGIRALVLHGVVAVAHGVESEPIVQWFREQGLWEHATPNEVALLESPTSITERQRIAFAWDVEAEWTFLWMVRKIPVLGLPTSLCDTRLLIEEIIPELGTSVEPFLATCDLQPQDLLFAEDDRTYDLWCYYNVDKGAGKPLPTDIQPSVLQERVKAFEWLNGWHPWDECCGDS